MRTIGLVVSHKSGEKRRAVLPDDINRNVKHPGQLYFEKGYGEAIGISDDCYTALGCHIVSRDEALSCDVIVDVKLGDAYHLDSVKYGSVIIVPSGISEPFSKSP